MLILQNLHLIVICLFWINVEGTGIKITLWELKLRLEQFIRSTGQHVMDFGNQLTNYDKQKCKELWKNFEDAATSLSTDVVEYSLFERTSSLGE
ncbi:hypothetical protein D915_010870 [Fasciola hepatica]|uniref:Secreted protein n=1 Tax=Fasciola hepatica TaxID=6192 RepID=A0A4E0RAI2_FASHE|nr:hypothetical protein D915_010870 [Fasciola hepatica]